MPDLPFLKRFPLALLILLALAVAAVLVVAALKPTAALTSLYKLHVLAAAGLLGWWLDHVLLFPYARPAGYLTYDWRLRMQHLADDPQRLAAERAAFEKQGWHPAPHFPVLRGHSELFIAACIRRALVVVGAMIAASLVL